jgi:hypothetical protein
MQIGEVEFEVDVPENKVQPMYDEFLSMVERRAGAADGVSGVGETVPAHRPNVEATVLPKSSAHTQR